MFAHTTPTKSPIAPAATLSTTVNASMDITNLDSAASGTGGVTGKKVGSTPKEQIERNEK